MAITKQPLVSILIPAFNAEEWIADTIRSAVAQTWPRKEIILVDDGSHDQTLSVARKFASREVHITSTVNAGAAAARNKAYALSQGDYIQWLDADDLLAPDKVERQLSALGEDASESTLLSSPWGYFRYRPHRAKFAPTALWQDLSRIEWLLHKMGDQSFMQTATWLTSRKLCDAAGPWNTELSYDDDGEYFCRVLLASSGTRFVSEANVFYRNAASNRLSHIGLSNTKMDSLLRSMKLHVTYLRSMEDSERVTEACFKYLQSWSVYFDPERRDITAELRKMAKELGRKLGPPKIRWKYAWMSPILGRSTAWHVQNALPHYKHRMICLWDRIIDRVEKSPIGAATRTRPS